MKIERPLVIGVTDCGRKFPNYENWLKAHGPQIEVLKLGDRLGNLEAAGHCDAFVMTGGHDVHPRFYGKPEYLEVLDRSDLDEHRDTFELKVIAAAEKRGKPLLGICRGLQITNTYFGGTLVPDIFTHLNADGHNQNEDDADSLHHILVEPGTLLSRIVHQAWGEVNSAHHQSADQVAEGFRANAFSKEGVVEGMELNSGDEGPGCLLVQWHPERMLNQESRFAGNLREWLIAEAWKWK
jgi:putative glutamine amidotransferase